MICPRCESVMVPKRTIIPKMRMGAWRIHDVLICLRCVARVKAKVRLELARPGKPNARRATLFEGLPV